MTCTSARSGEASSCSAVANGLRAAAAGHHQIIDVLHRPFVLSDRRHAIGGMLAKLSVEVRVAVEQKSG